MTHNSSKLAIATLTYKMPELAHNIVGQLTDGPFDVFVFDNGGALDRPASWADHVHVISREDNLLFTNGWNWAMSHLGEYEYVWMLNDDLIRTSQEMAISLLAHFSAEAAVVTPAFNSPHRIFHRRFRAETRAVPWVDWCCPMVRMAAWEDVGPFDGQFIGYGADLDWCKRARLRGWRFYVRDDCWVYHFGSLTAMKHGMQGMQGNVAEMNRLLYEKWRALDWTEMIHDR